MRTLLCIYRRLSWGTASTRCTWWWSIWTMTWKCSWRRWLARSCRYVSTRVGTDIYIGIGIYYHRYVCSQRFIFVYLHTCKCTTLHNHPVTRQTLRIGVSPLPAYGISYPQSCIFSSCIRHILSTVATHRAALHTFTTCIFASENVHTHIFFPLYLAPTHLRSQSQVKCLLLQLLHGVAHLHKHWILHRDLKTANILLNNDGILKICDFGLARRYGNPAGM